MARKVRPMNETERIRILEKFGEEEVEVVYRKSPGVHAPQEFQFDGVGFYAAMNPRTYVEDGIRVDQDVPVKVRDGTTLYVDVYRPDGPEGVSNLPAIIGWCWYGKRPGDAPNKDWKILGVAPGTVSTMAKVEGPDPAYWCKQGYAVINADSRGAGYSEGNLVFWGTQDGQDGYDVVEWTAAQVWCNGNVGMFGNSGLAMCQWFIAAEQPPHLACIAPWEGTSDMYREFVSENGIPAPGFIDFVASIGRSRGYIEDYMAMMREYPLINAYWESKIPHFEKIKIPTYVTGGWSHLHLRGSVNGFRRIRSAKKWLRLHREFEWPDSYSWWNLEDLKRFFDRYLKDIRNGWEMTPRVRLEVMDAYDYDYQVNRPEKEFPLARTEYKKLYLDAAGCALDPEPVEAESKASYDGNEGMCVFDMQFDEDTEITGFMKARLWVEADGHDEMDLFLTVLKLDENGEWLPTSVLGEPHPGAWGRLRVSHRHLDPELSTDYQPVQSHRTAEKLKPGEIVPVEIAFYPHSRIWHKGQTLRLRVCGRYIREGWFEPFSWDTDNKGNHVIHTGGQYDSHLQIPVIPPKYKAGDYVHR
jgi:uncharacterized protein